jgi:hypothetical protein
MALIPGTLPTGTKYPNDPQSLLDTFAAYMTAPEVKKNRPTVTVVAPASGGTVTFNTNGQDETLFLDIAAGITGLTVTLPTAESSAVGQTVRVWPRSAVSATIVITKNAGGTSQTVRGSDPSSLSASTNYEWQKVASSPHTWIRVH